MASTSLYLRIQTRGTALATGEIRTKTVYNVWDFKRASSSPTLVKLDIKNTFKTTLLTPLANCLSVSYKKAFIDVRFLDDPLDPYLSYADGVDGQVSGDSLPSVNNACIQTKTGIRGRKYRGSKHLGPIAESSTLLDYLTSGAITLFTTFMTAWLAGFADGNGNTWLPYLVSQKDSTFNPTTATVVAKPITSMTINQYLGIMRKRSQERVNTM